MLKCRLSINLKQPKDEHNIMFIYDDSRYTIT